jgi:hypothetical protein
MFNVSGLRGVELVFKNDQRFRIGSDQPQELLYAIQPHLQKGFGK